MVGRQVRGLIAPIAALAAIAACLAPDACLDILIGVAVAWLRWRSPWARPSNH